MSNDRIEVLGVLADRAVELVAPDRVTRHTEPSVEARPACARWSRALERRYTVGVEEELKD